MLTDAELPALMQAYLDGRIEAFDALYEALAGRIRGYLASLCRDAALADDLAQETFLQMHRSRRTYEPGRPVAPWVFAIAYHVYLMNRRRTGRRLRFEETLAADARAIVTRRRRHATHRAGRIVKPASSFKRHDARRT